MTVDALFRRRHFDNGVYVQHLLFLDLTVDGNGPRTRLEVLRYVGGLVLVGREFVIVVVIGDVFVGSDRLSGREWALLNAINLGVGLCHFRWRSELAQADASGNDCRAS